VWVSHYVMHLTSPLADNIANNVVGLVLGMLFRFALYRWWVFAPGRRDSVVE
jgi:putative flippase GtrA